VAAGADPENVKADAGHPSTYQHVDRWGNDVGYYEYGKHILSNWDNHHMGIKGNVASECFKCHANDINDPQWDYTDPELIRYCEKCHDINTLHTIYEHVGPDTDDCLSDPSLNCDGTDTAVKGWAAVGFHAPGSGEPSVYRSFEANEQCFGCHADAVPTISLVVEPMAGCPGGLITLTGTNFDPELIGRIPGREVQMKISGQWTNLVSVYSWNDLQIEFEIPGWVMPAGNYRVRVWDGNRTPLANRRSNEVILTVKDCNSPTTITPDSGPCSGAKISLANPTGVGFGPAQDTISGTGATDGVFRTVQVSASQGDYIPLSIPTWNNSQVKFKFLKFFEDLDGDFLQDGNEPTIEWCEGLNLQEWNVFIKYVFYKDSDSSTSYSDGDMLYQVESSNPLRFELTDDPFITGLNPKSLAKSPTSRLRVLGVNFGLQLAGDEVRLGSLRAYNTDPFNKGKVFSVVKKWSNTKIVVKFFRGVPNAWKGSNKKVWVVKDGVASNAKKITILP
jgi:hypothetical protein